MELLKRNKLEELSKQLYLGMGRKDMCSHYDNFKMVYCDNNCVFGRKADFKTKTAGYSGLAYNGMR